MVDGAVLLAAGAAPHPDAPTRWEEPAMTTNRDTVDLVAVLADQQTQLHALRRAIAAQQDTIDELAARVAGLAGANGGGR